MVPQWQTPYLGARSLPKKLSSWEVDHFFTLTPDERDEICSRYSGLYQLAAALQLGFLRMTGCSLGGVHILPRNLLEYIGAQLDIDTPTIASVRALYRRLRTRYQHQQWAAGILIEVEHTQYQDVIAVIPESVCTQWLDALYQPHPRYQVQLIDWLKTPPAKRFEMNLSELFDKIEVLKSLGVHR